MDWGNIGSLEYMPDLNIIYTGRRKKLTHRKGLAFMQEHGLGGIKKGLEAVFKRIVSDDNGDAHLRAFLINDDHSGPGICREMNLPPTYGVIMAVYPFKGEVKEYELNNGDFLTNVHQNQDPLIVADILGDTCLSCTTTIDEGGERYHEMDTISLPDRGWVPSWVYGGIFFKKNVFENLGRYKRFAEFLKSEKQ